MDLDLDDKNECIHFNDFYQMMLTKDEVLMALYNAATPKRDKIPLETATSYLTYGQDFHIDYMFHKSLFINLSDLNNLDLTKYNKENKVDGYAVLKKAILEKISKSPLKDDVSF